MALNIEHKVENQGRTVNGRLSAEEFNQVLDQVNRNTPQLVASEEAFEAMIEAGEIVEGQIYYIAEE